MVLGIPTVKREVQSYLLATLQNLVDSMTEEEAADSLIVIFIAEVSNINNELHNIISLLLQVVGLVVLG